MLRQRMNRWGLPWPNNNSKRESESSRRHEEDDDDDSSFVSSGSTPMLLSKAEMNALPQLNHDDDNNNNSNTNGIVVYDDSVSRSGIWIDENQPESSSSSLVATPQQKQKQQLPQPPTLLVVDDDDDPTFLSIHRTTTPLSTKSSSKKKESMQLYHEDDSATDGAETRQNPPPSEVTSPLSTVNSNTPKSKENHSHPSHPHSKSNREQVPSFSSFFASNMPVEKEETQENRGFSSSTTFTDDFITQSSQTPPLLRDGVALSEREDNFIVSTVSNYANEENQGVILQSILSPNESDWQIQPKVDNSDFTDSVAEKVAYGFSLPESSKVVEDGYNESQDRRTKPTLSMLDLENNISHDSIGLLSTRSDTSQCSFNSVSSSRWIVENRKQQRLSKGNNHIKEEKKLPVEGKPPFNFESAYLLWMSLGMLPESFRPNAKFHLVKKMDRELEHKLKHRRQAIESEVPATSHNAPPPDQSFSVNQQQQQQQQRSVTQPTVLTKPNNKDKDKSDGKNFENILNRWKEVSADKPCSHFLAFQQTGTTSSEETANPPPSKLTKPASTTTSRGITPSRRLSSHIPVTTQEEKKNPSMIAKLQSRTCDNEMTRRLSLPNRTSSAITTHNNNNTKKIPDSIENTRNTITSSKLQAGSTATKQDIIHSKPLPLRRDPDPLVAVEQHSTTVRTPHATLRVIGVAAAKKSPSPRNPIEPVIDISSSTRNLKLQAANMFGRRREKKNAEDGDEEEIGDSLVQTSSAELNQRPDYKSLVHAYLRDVDSKTNQRDPNQSRSKSVPRSTTNTSDNLVSDRETPCESGNDHTKIPSKNFKRSQSVPRANQKLDEFSMLAIRNQIRKEAACIQDALLRNGDGSTQSPRATPDIPCDKPVNSAPLPEISRNQKTTTTTKTSKATSVQDLDPVASLNAAIRSQLRTEAPSFPEVYFDPKNKNWSSPSEMVIRNQLRREVASLQQELCGVEAVTPSNALLSANFASKDALEERNLPTAYVNDLPIEKLKAATHVELKGKIVETPTNETSDYNPNRALSPLSCSNKSAFDQALPLERTESIQHREDIFSPFTKQVMEKLKKVNDVEQIASPPSTKAAFSQRPWQHDRLIRRVDSMTDESNSKLDTEPLVCGECNCSASVFSGNDDMVDFFLPLMGAACTCTKKPFGLINPEEPTSLVNILRPWQVEFLAGFGIYRGEELVKANHRSASALANALRQYRKRENLPPFPIQSCAMALQIWSKTSKAFVRSIRNQIKAAQEGSTESPPRSGKSTELKVPNTLYIISAFLDKMPKETDAIRTANSSDSKSTSLFQLDTVSTDFSDF